MAKRLTVAILLACGFSNLAVLGHLAFPALHLRFVGEFFRICPIAILELHASDARDWRCSQSRSARARRKTRRRPRAVVAPCLIAGGSRAKASRERHRFRVEARLPRRFLKHVPITAYRQGVAHGTQGHNAARYAETLPARMEGEARLPRALARHRLGLLRISDHGTRWRRAARNPRSRPHARARPAARHGGESRRGGAASIRRGARCHRLHPHSALLHLGRRRRRPAHRPDRAGDRHPGDRRRAIVRRRAQVVGSHEDPELHALRGTAPEDER